MYTFVKKIEVQGSDFVLLADRIAIVGNFESNNRLLLLDKESLKIIESLNDFKYNFIFESDSKIYFWDRSNNLYQFINRERISDDFLVKGKLDKNTLFIYKRKEGGYEVTGTGLFELSTQKITFYKENFRSRQSVIIYPNIIFENFNFNTASAKELVCYSIINEEKIWSYDVAGLGRYRRNSQSPEEAGKVEKIIGVYDDLLIVTITNSTVLAIDIHTGALKGKWRDLPEGQFYGKSKRTTLVYPFQSFIDQTQGKLIGLIGSYYWEIDLYGDSIYLYDATEEFDKHQVGTQTSGQITPQGEHIFFASEYILPSAQRVQKVAAFNRSTKLIDWSYTFEDLAPMVMPKAPVIEGDRLYILDTGGTLHIFERKEVL